jgi:hypothetical protein
VRIEIFKLFVVSLDINLNKQKRNGNDFESEVLKRTNSLSITESGVTGVGTKAGVNRRISRHL